MLAEMLMVDVFVYLIIDGSKDQERPQQVLSLWVPTRFPIHTEV